MPLQEVLDSHMLQVEFEQPTNYVSDDDQSDDSGPEFIETTAYLPSRQTISLSVRSTYTNWNPREAFRELVQNWRDGIISSFDLDEKDFVVECDRRTVNRKLEIIFKVPRPNSSPKEWLGFIHFRSQGEGGIVELTNRRATIHPWHLDMGGTSKSGSGNLAGAHGEGLKVALLVMMRGDQNHKVCCRSDGFSWTFNFTKNRRLVARLRRVSDDTLRRWEAQGRTRMAKMLAPFVPNAKTDVQFFLGEPHSGRSENGTPTQRRLVSPRDFESWTEAALFLQNPSQDELVRTGEGDLLIGERFRRRLYLKGLLLREDTEWHRASVTGKPLRYGYNISAGTTNRERQSVASAYEESATIIRIWAKALVIKPELASELSNMLNSTEVEYADVVGAKTGIGRSTAQVLWSYLTRDTFRGIWYYSPQEKRDCPRLNDILLGLGYEGSELSQLYWDILRKHKLVQTADEEQRTRFMNASSSTTPVDAFMERARRSLRATVHACELSKGTMIKFVSAGRLDLQSLYVEDQKLFIIHERLLSQQGIVDALGLPPNLVDADIHFHAVIELFSDLLAQLPAEVFSKEQSAKSIEWQRKAQVRLAEQRLFDLAHLAGIRISTSNSGRVFHTEWVASRRTPGTEIEIQYHSVSCGRRLQDSILIAGDVLSSTIPCLCAADALPMVYMDADSGTQQSPFRVLRTLISETNHNVMKVQQGQDYMLLFFVPSDKRSLASWRDGPFAEQHGLLPEKIADATDSAASLVNSDATEGHSATFFTPVSPSISAALPMNFHHSSNVDRPRASGGRQPSVAEPDRDSVADCFASSVAKYELGHKLAEFNILSVNDWYEGVNISAVGRNRAVIGLLEQGVDSPSTRKRKQRTLSSEQDQPTRTPAQLFAAPSSKPQVKQTSTAIRHVFIRTDKEKEMSQAPRSSAKGHSRNKSSASRPSRPRASTKGPLDIDDDPLSPPGTPPVAQGSPNPSLRRGPASPRERQMASSPVTQIGEANGKDFSFLLRPEIYHPLTPLNVPLAFRNSSKQPDPKGRPEDLLARGHFRAAAIAAVQELTGTGSGPGVDSHDTGRIFELLYTRLACLTLIDATALAAQEVKALEDLNSVRVYVDDATGEHLVPWDLRVLNVRLQALGFGDPRRAVMSYHDLAREARERITRAAARHDNSESELWKARLQDLGIKVAGALIDMDDLSGAAHQLKTLRNRGDARLELSRALLWLQLGDADGARECASHCVDDAVTMEKIILALCDMAESEYEAALGRWQALRAELDDEMVNVNAAICLLYLGRIVEGRDILEELVDKGYSSHTLLFNLSTVYELCTEKNRNLKMKLTERVAAMDESQTGWEKSNGDFKL